MVCRNWLHVWFSVEKPNAFGDLRTFKLKKELSHTIVFFFLYHWRKQHEWIKFLKKVSAAPTKSNFWGDFFGKVIFYKLRNFSGVKISISQTMPASDFRKKNVYKRVENCIKMIYRHIFNDKYFSSYSEFKVFKALRYIENRRCKYLQNYGSYRAQFSLVRKHVRICKKIFDCRS